MRAFWKVGTACAICVLGALLWAASGWGLDISEQERRLVGGCDWDCLYDNIDCHRANPCREEFSGQPCQFCPNTTPGEQCTLNPPGVFGCWVEDPYPCGDTTTGSKCVGRWGGWDCVEGSGSGELVGQPCPTNVEQCHDYP